MDAIPNYIERSVNMSNRSEKYPMQSESVAKIAAAMAKAQGEMEDARKSGKQTHYGGKYADISDVLVAIRKAFSSNSIAISQQPTLDDDRTMLLITTLMHSSGEWIKSYYPVKPKKEDAQGYGSAITYARRYSLTAVLGLGFDDDDDGEAAVGRYTCKIHKIRMSRRKVNQETGEVTYFHSNPDEKGQYCKGEGYKSK